MTKLNLKALGFGCLMGVVLSILTITTDPSPVTFIGFFIAMVMGMMAWIKASMKRKMRKVIDPGDSLTNYDVDVSAEQRPLPIQMMPTALQLSNLGFRRLGEQAVASAEGKELGVEWSYISADGRVVAGVTPSQGLWGGMLMGFVSIFPDETWCITMYPSGGSPRHKTIEHPDLWLHHVYTSIEDAYRRHLEYVEKFARNHGDPRVFRTMSDYHVMSPIFRQKGYNELTLSRLKLIEKLDIPIPAVLALIALLATFLGSIAPDIAQIILILCLPAAFIYTSWVLPIHPRVSRIFSLVFTGLAVMFIPLAFVWTSAVLVQSLLMLVLSQVLLRYVPAEAKAFAKAIQEGQTDVDWQGRGL